MKAASFALLRRLSAFFIQTSPSLRRRLPAAGTALRSATQFTRGAPSSVPIIATPAPRCSSGAFVTYLLRPSRCFITRFSTFPSSSAALFPHEIHGAPSPNAEYAIANSFTFAENPKFHV